MGTVIVPNIPHWHQVTQDGIKFAREREKEERKVLFHNHRELMYLTGKLDPYRDRWFVEELLDLYDEYAAEKPEPPRAS